MNQDNQSEVIENNAAGGEVTIPRVLFDFLMGQGQIYGAGFGDDCPQGLPRKFWWRALLRACDRPSLSTPSDKEALYRDIFAEITAKAQPLCEDGSDPEKITGYRLPVGPLHRAAGNLSFQMFDGERHLTQAVNRIHELEAELGRQPGHGWKLSDEAQRQIEQMQSENASNCANMPPHVLGSSTPSEGVIEDRFYEERLEYEQRILDAEMRVEKIKRLVRQPEEPGSYVGDTYYPVGGTQASHQWDGTKWYWLPEYAQQEDEALT
jgi:hypothetical protein